MLRSKNLVVLFVCVVFTTCLPQLASALIAGPYTADANTTFLFHFDEASGGSVTTNLGTVGGKAYTVTVGTGGGTSIAATNVTTLLGGTAYSAAFTNAITFPATNAGYIVGFAGSSSSFTTDTGNGGTRSPNAIAESVLGIGASANSPWTIEALIKPNVTNFNQEIVCMDSYASSRGFQFKLTTAGQVQFQTIGGTAYSQVAGIPSSGANAFVPGTWYHVAVVYNGSTMQLYWTAVGNGVTAASPLGSAATPTSGSMGTTQGAVTGPLIIGNKDRLPALETFNGSIDEVRISNVARSAAQMMFSSATITLLGQPIGQEGVDYGGTGSFSVSAASALPISYQWRLNGLPITGATNTTYTFTNAVSANAGNYDCVMTNSNPYSITSSVASVVIGAANFLTNRYSFITDASDSIGGQNGTNVGGVTYNPGGTVTLDGSSGYIQLPSNIINTNSGAVTIETWCTFGTIANNSMLFAFGNTNGTSGYNYIFATPHGGTARMAITAGTYTGEQGAVTGAALDNSNNVQVVCVFAPDLNTETFYVNGVQAAINTNASLPLSSVIDNFSLIGHSLFSGDPYLAGTINEFRIYAGAMSAASVMQSYQQGYQNKLSDGPVAFIYSPTNISTAQGLPVTFSAIASGHQAILYQWLKNGSPIAGATNTSYTYSPTFADNNATFQLLATNTVSATTYSAASGTATLTVSVPATLTWFNNSQDGSWNLTSGNWNNNGVAYAQFDGVVFNDSDDTNSTPGPTVNLQFAATPILMTVSNTLQNYVLDSSSGNGSLALSGTLVKQGTGTFTLDVTNTSATPVIVQNGTLQVGNGDTTGSLGTGPVTNNSTLVFDRTDSIGLPNDLHGSGSLVLNSGTITPTSTNNDYTGSTTINGGIFYAGYTNALGYDVGGITVNNGGQLYLTGNVNFGPAALALAGTGDGNGALRKGGAGTSAFSGAVTMTANTTIGIDSGATLTLGNTLSGTANLTKNGTGTLNLGATNNYNGTTTVSSGALGIVVDGSLGSVPGSFTAGQLTLSSATLNAMTNVSLVDGNRGITINTAATLSVATGSTLLISNVITGSATTVTKSSPGTLVLAANNSGTLSGTFDFDTSSTSLSDGNTVIASPNAISGIAIMSIRNNNAGSSTLQLDGSNGSISIAPTTFNLNGRNNFVPAIENLDGNNTFGPSYQLVYAVGGTEYEFQSDSGTLTVSPASGVLPDAAPNGFRLTVFSGSGNVVVPAAIQDQALSALLTNSVLKAGSGTLTLQGNNTYVGSTTVSNGTLLVNGSISTGPVTVNGGILGGTGTISGPVTVNSGGTLSPGGNGAGTLTINSNITLNAGSTSTFAVNGSTPANGSVVAGGAVNYAGVLNIVPGGTFVNGQTFTLFSGAGAANAGNFASVAGNPGAGLGFTFTNGILSVVTAGPSGPAYLTNRYSGGTLTFTWPAGQSWRLVSQTNSLSVGLTTNGWFTVPGGIDGSNSIAIDPTRPTVFYRLTYP